MLSLDFDNGHDEKSVGMIPILRPTYQQIHDLPDGTEILGFWPDGEFEAYDVTAEFKRTTLQDAMSVGRKSLADYTGMSLLVTLTPDKMSDALKAGIAAAHARTDT